MQKTNLHYDKTKIYALVFRAFENADNSRIGHLRIISALNLLPLLKNERMPGHDHC